MNNDLISRKAVLEMERCGFVWGDDVRNMPAAPTWISVEERLPESESWVVVWYRDKDGDYFPTIGQYGEGAFGRMRWMTEAEGNDMAFPPEKITHWMPLPEPPKEERHE